MLLTLSSLLFRILMKFQSPLGVACNHFVHQCHGTVIQGSVVILVSRRNGRWRYLHHANIMTAWMTVTRTARTTWIVIRLTSRYSTINTLGGLIPFHQLDPSVKLSDRRANNLTELSARWRSCRPRADANRRHWR